MTVAGSIARVSPSFVLLRSTPTELSPIGADEASTGERTAATAVVVPVKTVSTPSLSPLWIDGIGHDYGADHQRHMMALPAFFSSTQGSRGRHHGDSSSSTTSSNSSVDSSFSLPISLSSAAAAAAVAAACGAPITYDDDRVRHHHQVAEFLYQLTRMLLDDNSDIIEWSTTTAGDNGRGRVVVHDPHRLEREVLGRYFRHSKFSSFQRQLNYFGFRKLAGKGKMSPCSYVNSEVTSDLRSLLGIKRKTNNCRSGNNKSSDKTRNKADSANDESQHQSKKRSRDERDGDPTLSEDNLRTNPCKETHKSSETKIAKLTGVTPRDLSSDVDRHSAKSDGPQATRTERDSGRSDAACDSSGSAATPAPVSPISCALPTVHGDERLMLPSFSSMPPTPSTLSSSVANVGAPVSIAAGNATSSLKAFDQSGGGDDEDLLFDLSANFSEFSSSLLTADVATSGSLPQSSLSKQFSGPPYLLASCSSLVDMAGISGTGGAEEQQHRKPSLSVISSEFPLEPTPIHEMVEKKNQERSRATLGGGMEHLMVIA